LEGAVGAAALQGQTDGFALRRHQTLRLAALMAE